MLDPTKWPKAQPRLQFDMNNSRSAPKGKTPKEMVYGFTPNMPVPMLKIPDIDIPSAKSKKLSQQYVGPFRVVERIGRLAYRLDVPSLWRVHNVFSIAYLETSPAPATDPYDRPRSDHLGTVFVEGDTDMWKPYELKRVLSHRVTSKGRTQYLVRWKGYGPRIRYLNGEG